MGHGNLPAVLAFCGSLCVGASALAHGQFPIAYDVQAPGGEPVVVSNYGVFFVSSNSGKALATCDELVADDPLSPALVVSPQIFVTGYFKGLYRSSDGGCNVEKLLVAGHEHYVRDFAWVTEEELYLVTSSGDATNGVFRSADRGATWEPQGLTLPGHFFTGVEPLGGSHRLFALSFEGRTGQYFAHWFTADGAWSSQEIADTSVDAMGQPVVDGCSGELSTCLIRGASDPMGRRIMVSPSSPAKIVREQPDTDLIGGAVYPDGTIVLATDSTLERSTDGGRTFSSLPSPIMVTCLRRDGQSLFLCANPYLPGGQLVSRSNDLADTWEPVLAGYGDIQGLLDCPAGSGLEAICGPLWPAIEVALGINVPDPFPADAHSDAEEPGDSGVSDAADGSLVDAPEDVASAEPLPRTDGGCSESGGAVGAWTAALASALWVAWNRRRLRPVSA
jgi:hypothetical protein